MFNETLALQALVVLGVTLVSFILLVRPQLRRAAEHAKFVTDLKPGDCVLTGGGFVGRIIRCDGSLLTIALAEGVHVVAVRDTVDGFPQANSDSGHPTVSDRRHKSVEHATASRKDWR